MPVEIPPGYGLAAWEFRFPGDPDPWYCTCGVDVSDNTADLEGAADALFVAWASTVLTEQSFQMTLSGVTLKVGNDGAPIMAYSTLPAVPGGLQQSVLPQNCALLVDKLSAQGGRRGRGRFYVPACLEEPRVSDIGVLDTNIFNRLTSQFSTFYDALTDPATPPQMKCPPVLLHSPSNLGVSNPTPAGDPTPITSFRVQTVISTQRQRLR